MALLLALQPTFVLLRDRYRQRNGVLKRVGTRERSHIVSEPKQHLQLFHLLSNL